MPKAARDIHIAIVDDETMILDVFSGLLKRAEFNAACFSSPDDALESFRRHPQKYDLLITDIYMPDGDGIVFASEVRKIVPNLPIMFMTGNASPDVRERAIALGRVEFLEKPFPLVDKPKELIPRFIG